MNILKIIKNIKKPHTAGVVSYLLLISLNTTLKYFFFKNLLNNNFDLNFDDLIAQLVRAYFNYSPIVYLIFCGFITGKLAKTEKTQAGFWLGLILIFLYFFILIFGLGILTLINPLFRNIGFTNLILLYGRKALIASPFVLILTSLGGFISNKTNTNK